jgi:hypothetical protein
VQGVRGEAADDVRGCGRLLSGQTES